MVKLIKSIWKNIFKSKRKGKTEVFSVKPVNQPTTVGKKKVSKTLSKEETLSNLSESANLESYSKFVDLGVKVHPKRKDCYVINGSTIEITNTETKKPKSYSWLQLSEMILDKFEMDLLANPDSVELPKRIKYLKSLVNSDPRVLPTKKRK